MSLQTGLKISTQRRLDDRALQLLEPEGAPDSCRDLGEPTQNLDDWGPLGAIRGL